jgi:hypothetical protein
MTKEEMIDLAKQSGWQYVHGESGYEPLWAFGKLVADKERDACIKIVMQGTGEPIQRKTLDILQQERTRIALAIKEQK